MTAKNFLMAVEAVIAAKAHRALAGKKAEAYVDSGVKILIAVVIGALLLGGLIALFNTVIFPRVKNEVEDLFDSNVNANISGMIMPRV